MELIDAISLRRSIRKYENKEVSDEIIEDLIESARLAPSAKNRQPWKFVVVKGDMIKKITDMMIEEINEKEVNLGNSSVKPTAEIMKEAPILILVLKEYDEYWEKGDNLSIGAAIEHILLRATDLGLGSLWIRDICFVQKEISKLVGHENMETISAISIGYPAQSPHQRPRKNLDEILEWK